MKIGNWPLMMLALEHIIKHADQYDQGEWLSDCGSRRCFGGWITYFAGWRDVISDNKPEGVFYGVTRTDWNNDRAPIWVDDAALQSLELNLEIYGEPTDAIERSPKMQDLARSLFGEHREFEEILSVVLDLMKEDGVTPTPLIAAEMRSTGILSDWDIW